MQDISSGSVAPVTQGKKGVLLGFGANLSHGHRSPAETLRAALDELQAEGFSEVRISPFFATPCFPPGAGPDYINGAAAALWQGTPAQALDALHRIELRHGRDRSVRWGMRTLDLDLLAVNALVLPDLERWRAWESLTPDVQRTRAPDALIVPHPRLAERAFVLVPLAAVAADWRHPVLAKSVAELLAALPEEARAQIVPL